METKINVVSESEHELEVNLGYDEIQKEIDEAYNKERKKIDLPGFRKGKVPLPMLKKMYGELIEHQASEEIANKKFWQIVEEQKLDPISTPKMTDINLERGVKLSFKIQYEVKPQLELKNHTGNEIKKMVWTVDDNDVDREIEYLVSSNRKLEPAEEITDTNYVIVADLQKIDDAGNDVEGIKSENISIDLSDMRVSQDIKEKAVNKKAGESFEFSFHDHHEVEEEGEKKVVHEDIHYRCTVKSIQKIVLPELTDEFVQKITKNKFKNLEEWRNNIKNGLQDYYNHQSEDMYINSLLSTVVKNNDFTPPHGYVHFLLDRIIRSEEEKAKRDGNKKFDKHEAHNRLHGQAEWSAKWQIIVANIAKKENLTVEETELETLAQKEAEDTGISVEKLMKYYKDTNRTEALLEEKVIDFLKKNNDIKEVNAKETQDSTNKEGE